MTPAVFWMRHGTCDDGLCRPEAHARPDSPLTIGGAVETELTAQHLRDYNWQPAVVASSPIRRARQSAAIVANKLGARLAHPFAAFAEWQAPTCVHGHGATQYPPEYRTWRDTRVRDLDSALPGGESLRAFADRALEATTIAHDLAADNGPMLIVSHRLLIGAVAALHCGQRHPADIFGVASDFRLAPAQLWTPDHTQDTSDQQRHRFEPSRPAEISRGRRPQ